MADTSGKKKRKGDPALARRIIEAIDVYSGKNQRQIALEIGITPQSITKARKHGYIDKANVGPFCIACGVSIDWLITGKGEPTARDPLLSATPEQISAAARRLSLGERLELAQDLIAEVSRETRKSESK